MTEKNIVSHMFDVNGASHANGTSRFWIKFRRVNTGPPKLLLND